MRIGFLGTGTITAAMVEGLFRRRIDFERVLLSPRNATVAARLARIHENISVADDNQAVLDGSDVVVLAVRPQIAEDVVRSVVFDLRHHVISVVATLDLATVRSLVGPVTRVTRAIPLPFVADNAGMTPYYPPDPIAQELFDAIGTAMETSSEDELDLLLTASGMMGTYFQILHECSGWLGRHGLEETKGRAYLASLFLQLSSVAQTSPHKEFERLRDEFSTKGGVNELGYQLFRSEGGSHGLRTALEEIHWRVSPKTKLRTESK